MKLMSHEERRSRRYPSTRGKAMKLTKAQIDALNDYSGVFSVREDGYAYPSELGIHTNIVAALHSKGYLERDAGWNGANVDYRITEAGRKALAEGKQ